MTHPLAIRLTDNNIFTNKFLLLFIFETPELLIWVVYEETSWLISESVCSIVLILRP